MYPNELWSPARLLEVILLSGLKIYGLNIVRHTFYNWVGSREDCGVGSVENSRMIKFMEKLMYTKD